MRFDEVELEAVPLGVDDPPFDPPPASPAAPRVKRLLALLTDLSLFAALALALSPLLPQPQRALPLAALAGFVLMISYYYFVGAWMLWGRTIGGAIFDVRVSTISLGDATKRWAILLLSLTAMAAVIRVAWMMR